MGVSIDGHELRIVGPFVNQDLANFSRLNFLGVSDPIDGCEGRTVGSATVRLFHRCLRLHFFSVKLFFVCLFWLQGFTRTISN